MSLVIRGLDIDFQYLSIVVESKSLWFTQAGLNCPEIKQT